MKSICLIVIVISLTACDFKSSEDYHKEANVLEKQEKYKEAITLLDKTIAKDPKNIKALTDRAVDRSCLKDYKGAIADHSKILEIDPDNTLAFLNRGRDKMKLQDYKSAVDDFNKAIRTKGGEMIYTTKVENSFIATDFEFDVEMEEIRFERGIAYYRIDSLRKAFSDLNFSIEKKYSLPDCYYWRALIYLSYKMKEEGCKDLAKAKELGDIYAQELIEKYCH